MRRVLIFGVTMLLVASVPGLTKAENEAPAFYECFGRVWDECKILCGVADDPESCTDSCTENSAANECGDPNSGGNGNSSSSSGTQSAGNQDGDSDRQPGRITRTRGRSGRTCSDARRRDRGGRTGPTGAARESSWP